MSVKCQKKKSKPIFRKIWQFSLADFDCAAKLLDAIEWEEILPNDVKSYRADLKTHFLQVMELCIPQAMIKFKKAVLWMNSAIGKAIKKRDSLFRIAKRSRKPTDRAKYNAQWNKVCIHDSAKQTIIF